MAGDERTHAAFPRNLQLLIKGAQHVILTDQRATFTMPKVEPISNRIRYNLPELITKEQIEVWYSLMWKHFHFVNLESSIIASEQIQRRVKDSTKEVFEVWSLIRLLFFLQLLKHFRLQKFTFKTLILDNL